MFLRLVIKQTVPIRSGDCGCDSGKSVLAAVANWALKIQGSQAKTLTTADDKHLWNYSRGKKRIAVTCASAGNRRTFLRLGFLVINKYACSIDCEEWVWSDLIINLQHSAIFPCEGCAVSLRDVLSKIHVQQCDFTGQLTRDCLKREFLLCRFRGKVTSPDKCYHKTPRI